MINLFLQGAEIIGSLLVFLLGIGVFIMATYLVILIFGLILSLLDLLIGQVKKATR